MALGDTNISVTAVQTEIGISTPDTVSGLCQLGSLNFYAFWGPFDLQFNGTTGALEAVTATQPYRLGDFRRYRHNASTPTLRMTNTALSADPTESWFEVPVFYDNFEANILRANNSINRFRLRYYTTLSDAQNDTNPLQLEDSNFEYFGTISTTNTAGGVSTSPALSGHNVQTTSCLDSTQLINPVGVGIPVPVTTTAQDRWVRMDFYINTVTKVGYAGTNILAFTIRQKAQPVLNTLTFSSPAGDGNYFVDRAANQFYNSGEGSVTNQTSLTIRIKVKTTNGNQYRQNVDSLASFYTDRKLKIRYFDGSTEHNIGYESVTYSLAASTANADFCIINGITADITFTIPNGGTWSYDSVHTLRFYFNEAP